MGVRGPYLPAGRGQPQAMGQALDLVVVHELRQARKGHSLIEVQPAGPPPDLVVAHGLLVPHWNEGGTREQVPRGAPNGEGEDPAGSGAHAHQGSELPGQGLDVPGKGRGQARGAELYMHRGFRDQESRSQARGWAEGLWSGESRK